MRQEAHQRLVELHPLRRLGTIRGHRALRSLCGDRAGTVGKQQSDEGLKCEKVGSIRFEPEQRHVGDFCQRPISEDFFIGDTAKTPWFMTLDAHRCADQGAEQSNPPWHGLGGEPRDALAHQRAPRERRGDCAQHRLGARMSIEAFHVLNEYGFRSANL